MNNLSPTLISLAKMSLNTYGESNNPPTGWDDDGNSLEFNGNRFHGHYAKVYKSKKDNTYVIANRGTRTNRTNLEGVLIDVVLNDLPIGGLGWCYSARKALEYFNFTYERLYEEHAENFKIYVTGHSKGAFEAAYIVKSLKNMSTKIPRNMNSFIGGVGFNCPGFGVKINPLGLPIWNSGVKNSSSYPFLNINREGDVISNNFMGILGRELLLPGDGLIKPLSNHAMDYKYELFQHYKDLGELEINEESIYNLSMDDIDKAIIKARESNITWINNSNQSVENKEALIEITHGIGSLMHIEKSKSRLLKSRDMSATNKAEPKL